MLLTLALLATFQSTPADSITGNWQLKGEAAGNPLNTVCEIKQSGALLSGACTNEQGEKQPITGEVKGGTFTFHHGGNYQGTELTITYSAKFETPTKLAGTLDVQPFSVGGSFTAEPVPARK